MLLRCVRDAHLLVKRERLDERHIEAIEAQIAIQRNAARNLGEQHLRNLMTHSVIEFMQ